jgi:UPF0755 protein
MLRYVYKLWFTGIIAILAACGYCLYGFLWAAMAMRKFIVKVAAVFLILALCLVGGAAWAFNYYFMPDKAVAALGEAVQLTVERGTGALAVSDTLAARGVVRSGKAFYYWLRYADISDKIQAGRFTFVKGEGAVSAADKLLKAEVTERTVFVPEGLTIEQTASKVAPQIGIDSAEFVKLCNDTAFIAALGIKAPTLEGYLFPDTYRFPESGVTAEAVVRRMAARFGEVGAGLKWSQAIKAAYDLRQVVTLASIVEKEATLPSERGRIAGVFHNRLRKGWPLGADPTVRYIYRKFSGPLLVSELNSPSPYNTRRFAGLPPGPICSPGLGAIQASAKPDSTADMFFVALWDGSGAHDFSVTNEEHDRKKLKIRKENEARVRNEGKVKKMP